jgi:hypothetical protein
MGRPIGRRQAVRALAAGGFAAALFRPLTRVAATEVELSKVPGKIQEAAKQLVPAAKWSAADKSKEDGQDLYEITGQDDKGRKVIVEVTPDGKVTELKISLQLTDVPLPAWEAVAANVPTFEAITAYELRQGDDLLKPTDDDYRGFEVGGVHAKDKQVIIEVTAEGEIGDMEKEIALSDVPRDVAAALKAKMPRFQAKTVFEYSEDGTVTGYVFEGKRPRDKAAIDVFVSADGKEIEIED